MWLNSSIDSSCSADVRQKVSGYENIEIFDFISESSLKTSLCKVCLLIALK